MRWNEVDCLSRPLLFSRCSRALISPSNRIAQFERKQKQVAARDRIYPNDIVCDWMHHCIHRILGAEGTGIDMLDRWIYHNRDWNFREDSFSRQGPGRQVKGGRGSLIVGGAPGALAAGFAR